MWFLLSVLLFPLASSAPFKQDDDLEDFAELLTKSANFSADPCEDFYDFVCGSWSDPKHIFEHGHEHSFMQIAQSLSSDAAARVLAAKSSEESDNGEVEFEQNMRTLKTIMRKYHKECKGKKTEPGPTSEEEKLSFLRAYDFVRILDDSSAVTWNNLSTLLGKTMGKPFIHMEVKEERKGRFSAEAYSMTPELNKIGAVDFDKVAESIKVLRSRGLNKTEDSLRKVVEGMNEITRILLAVKQSDWNDRKYVTLVNLTEIPMIDWDSFFVGGFSIKPSEIANDNLQTIRVNIDLPYFKKVFQLLGTANRQSIALLIFMHLNACFDDQRTDRMFGGCDEQIAYIMPGILSASFSKAQPGYEAKKLGSKILEEVHSAFFDLLDENEWMSEHTKKVIKDRLQNIDRFIGYSPVSNIFLQKFLSDLDYQESDSSRVILKKIAEHRDRSTLRAILTNEKYFDEFMPAHVVNAFYSPRAHRIVILSGIMQAPLVSSRYPASVNYGGIGSVMGHEIAHSFGSYGTEAEYTGRPRLLTLEPTDEEKFTKRIQCLVDRFDNQTDYVSNRKLDGRYTENENLADHTGLRAAIRAFENYEKKNGRVKTIRVNGREFTGAQQFYVGFSMIECSKPEEHNEGDPHSPGRQRVNIVLQNKPEFAKAFNCPAKSTMNPEQRCRIW